MNPDIFKNSSNPLFVLEWEFAELLKIKDNEGNLQKLFGLYSQEVSYC